MSEEISNNEFTKMCIALQSNKKNQRVQNLKKIRECLELQQSESEICKLWEVTNKALLRILNDSAEVCRDQGLEIIRLFIINLMPDDKYIMHLFPILSRRLGSSEQIETSEEVRLKCVILLKIIIIKYKNLLVLYIDDIMKILVHTITDNYPLVKRESCNCVSEFAKNLSTYFYAQSGTLIKPILSNFTHQHYKVRIVSIQAIGDLIQYGNSNALEEVTTPLAERLFDQNGFVRTTIIEIAGCWLLKLRDRYSWWHKILPLLLTGLHDELEEIRQKATNFWNIVGQSYIEENRNDEKFKDKLDFLTKDPYHYPNVDRPNLGCCVIAQQTFSKLINGITLELGDWIADIRLRTAQLLCLFILHLEENVTQYIGKLLPSMYRACNDEDNRVVENIERAAEYLGYFVHPKIYCQLIIPTLEETPSVGHLKIFAAFLRCSIYSTLFPSLRDVAKFLQKPHICQSKKTLYQEQVLSCCNSLILVCKEDCKLVLQDLFIIIFTTLSMTQENSVKLKANNLLNTLANITSYKNVEELCNENFKYLISLLSDYKLWSVHSPESEIFCGCLIYIKKILINMNIILPILKEVITNSIDSELKLKYFIVLSEYFNQGSLNEIMDLKFFNQFLEDCILPGLIWSAGKAAEAIRTATLSCLCIVLDKYKEDLITERIKHIDSENILSILDNIIPSLISLTDDNCIKSRLYSLRALHFTICVRERFSNVAEESIHKIYPVLLRRLDDTCDDIRLASLEALTKLWNIIPEDYNLHFNKGHIDTLYTTVIIYLDDPEYEFQNHVSESLKELAKVHPQLLYQKLQNCKTNFRNQKNIDILLDHCQNIFRAYEN